MNENRKNSKIVKRRIEQKINWKFIDLDLREKIKNLRNANKLAKRKKILMNLSS